MGWTPETSTRPRVAPVDEIGRRYDAALDGEPLMLAYDDDQTPGYEQVSAEIGIEQTSTSDDISENKLSGNEFWRTMRNWQGGLGQRRFDVPQVSSDDAYYDSTTIDTRVPGQLTLAPKTTVAAPATFENFNHNSDQASDGIWFISRISAGTQAVTHYDLTTFTTKTIALGAFFRDVAVGPDDTCWIASDTAVYSVTKTTSITAWTALTFTVGKLCAAKQRLFMAATAGGDTFERFYELATEGTPPVAPTSKLALAPGMKTYDIKEAGALVLFAVNPFNFSVGAASIQGAGRLYAYDGTNAPTTVLVLPQGEQITCIHPILGGSQVLLFVRRNDRAGTVRALIYVVEVQGTTVGNPRIVFEYPDSYTEWFVNEAISLGQQVYFVGPNDPARGLGFGIDAYDIVNGTVSHYLTAPTVQDVSVQQLSAYQGRLIYDQIGASASTLVIASDTDYVASAELVTSVIDLNVDAPKTWTVVEAGCKPLLPGQRIDVYWTADDPSVQDWRVVGSLHPGQTSASWPLQVTSIRLALRAVLVAPASPTSTPALTKLGVAAQLARLPKRDHRLLIQAYPRQQGLDDRPLGVAGEDTYWRVANRLEELRDAGQVVWFQPPHSRFDGHAERVKVGAISKQVTGNPAKGFGGKLTATLHNVDPDRRNLLPLSVASYPSLPVSLAIGDVFEAVGGSSLSVFSPGTSWTAGPQTFWPQVTPAAAGDGVRAPKAHQSVAWRALAGRGLPFSAGVLVRPTSPGMKFTLAIEARDAADSIVQTTTGTVFSMTDSGVWLPVWVEGVTFDSIDSEVIYLTVKLLVASGSTIGAFGHDGWQLEQSRIATRWQQPPSNF